MPWPWNCHLNIWKLCSLPRNPVRRTFRKLHTSMHVFWAVMEMIHSFMHEAAFSLIMNPYLFFWCCPLFNTEWLCFLIFWWSTLDFYRVVLIPETNWCGFVLISCSAYFRMLFFSHVINYKWGDFSRFPSCPFHLNPFIAVFCLGHS